MPDSPEYSDFREEQNPFVNQPELDDARSEFARRTLHHWEKSFIENGSPKLWPHYPVLCVAHRRDREPGGSPFKQPGLIHASEPAMVAAINVYDLPAFGGSMTDEEIEGKLIRYDCNCPLYGFSAGFCVLGSECLRW